MTDVWFNFLNVIGRLKEVRVSGGIESFRSWVKVLDFAWRTGR